VIGLDRYPFCVPLQVNAGAEVDAALERWRHEVRYFEIWLDYLSDRSVERASGWAEMYPGRCIFLFRRRPGEAVTTTADERRAFWRALAPQRAWIDLDHRIFGDEIEFVRGLGGRVTGIVSHHDFERTPRSDELRVLVDDLIRVWPEAVVKIATRCAAPGDAAALIDLATRLAERGAPRFTILGMGREGRAVRIANARLGNVMNFAPTDERSASAPGQIPLAELRAILAQEGV
jgi:3-dehydroquinate dehydratase type I